MYTWVKSMSGEHGSGEQLLRVENIDVSYDELKALWGVSLEINVGEFVTLVGANCAGKSTLLKTISGLLKPTSGIITFFGKNITGLPPYIIAKMGITHIIEREGIFPYMNVLENLEVAANVAKNRMKDNLEFVFQIYPVLKERRNQLAGTLSGGERRMLTIGMGLMSEPKLMLIDELSLGLAPKLAVGILNTIKKINEEGVSILLVEQNVVNALKVADRGYVLENGKIVLEGEGKKLLEDKYVKKAYLGM